jgi:hypothetical protein
MQLSINLASEPFRNRTPFWIGIVAAFVVTMFAGVAVMARSGAIDAEAERLADDVNKQEQEIADLEARLAEIRAAEEAAVFRDTDLVALEEARELITRKSFSWSWLLVELEHYTPARSRLNSISVGSVSGFGVDRVVKMKLQFEGLDQRQVAEMLLSFDRSAGRFRAEPVSLTPSEEGPTVTYTLDVEYRPGVAADRPLPPAAKYLTSNQAGSRGGGREDEE